MKKPLIGCVLTLVVLGSLVACGQSGAAQSLKPETFANQVSDGTVVLYWNCTRPASGLLRVEGVVSNSSVPGPIRDVDLTLYGVDGTGRDVSRVTGSTASYQIPPMVTSPFRLDLPLAGGDLRFDLRYQYEGAFGGGSSDEGGASAVPSNLARDVCRGL
jgi:hypothetical protein